MSNFSNLNNYILPSDILLDMLKIYRYIGKNTIYEEKLSNNSNYLEQQTIEKDTFFLALLLNIDIPEQRMRLIITKNSDPRKKEEEVLSNIKNIIILIRKNAKEYGFNSSDLLSFINNVYGKGYAKFSQETKKINEEKKPFIKSINSNKKKIEQSYRNLFDKMLDEYQEYYEKNYYEKIFLSLIAYIEMVNIKPFDKGNELASLLMLYYMVNRSELNCFRYLSFFESFYTYKNEWDKEVKITSINYFEGFIQISGIARLLYHIVESNYCELEEIVRKSYYEEKINKSDNVEQTIYQFPDLFSKEDIRNVYPFVSEATINRVLNKLKDENYIVPLGKGRSAKWQKTHENEVKMSRILR